MKIFKTILLLICVVMGLCTSAQQQKKDEPWSEKNSFLVLCYHDIPKTPSKDSHGTDITTFVRQLDFLRRQGCNFVSVKDIFNAHDGIKPLPSKAVLLTFDRAFLTFYKNVFPMLNLFGYPALVSVITDWTDAPPRRNKFFKPLMSWNQLRKIARSPLITIASQTCRLNNVIPINAAGGTAPAVAALRYYKDVKVYETPQKYNTRIYQDLRSSRIIIKNKVGVNPEVLVWPYGKYNKISMEMAKKAGFKMLLTMDNGFANVTNLYAVPRILIKDNYSISQFSRLFKNSFKEQEKDRIIHADLDIVYDDNHQKMEYKIEKFVDRICQLGPSTVYLQAFCDIAGNGNIKSVYFKNQILPVKADIFGRVSKALSMRDIRVFAWMPMLSIQLPDAKENEKYLVREYKDGKFRITTSWYRRFSPFCAQGVEKIKKLYSDLAKNSYIDGIVFQDDGYLSDFEDFHPDALKIYNKITDGFKPYQSLSENLKKKWTEIKTDKLIEVSEEYKKVVIKHRPSAKFARIVYSPIVYNLWSEEWFAQNYKKCLGNYDYTVLMAYPLMEKARKPVQWLKMLVGKVKQHHGLKKTVFKLQSYDWNQKKWVNPTVFRGWLITLKHEGVDYVSYYPDNYQLDMPRAETVKDIIGENIDLLKR